MPSLFSHPMDECDVRDREKLARYREHAKTWHNLLHKDERQSIGKQFSEMLWQDAAWRAANEARRFALEDGPTSAISPFLGGLLDRGYVSGQIIAISRLLEKPNRDPKKGVISLRRIVDEMSACRDLFTREIFVCHDALPYDWRAAYAEEAALLPADGDEEKFRWLSTTGPLAWGQSSLLHETFDKLSGVPSDKRSREDHISGAIFDRLNSTLNDPLFAELLQLRHKLIAHAADEYSRAQIADLRSGLKLDEFAKAHYLLIGVFQIISSTILFGSWLGGAVPVAQGDHLKNLDKPFVQPERLNQLHDFWRRHCAERDEWLSEAYHELLPEISRR